MLSLYIASYKTIYIFLYNENVCCHYISFCILQQTFYYIRKCIKSYMRRCMMTTNISRYMEMYIVLYDKMYNENVCCHYTSYHIRRYTFSLYYKTYIVLYETIYNNNIYFSLYKTMYNDNKHFHYTRRCISSYTRRCIITTNIFVIHESVHRVIRDDV